MLWHLPLLGILLHLNPAALAVLQLRVDRMTDWPRCIASGRSTACLVQIATPQDPHTYSSFNGSTHTRLHISRCLRQSLHVVARPMPWSSIRLRHHCDTSLNGSEDMYLHPFCSSRLRYEADRSLFAYLPNSFLTIAVLSSMGIGATCDGSASAYDLNHCRILICTRRSVLLYNFCLPLLY